MNKKVSIEVEGLINKYNLGVKNLDREGFIEEFDWNSVNKYFDCSWDFFHEFKAYVDWISISCTTDLPEDFMREFNDELIYEYISQHQKLSENFIRDYKDHLDWINVLEYQELSENFLKELLNTGYIGYCGGGIDLMCCYQKLSEDFIRQHKKILDWQEISHYQNLSEDFVLEFIDREKGASHGVLTPAECQ